MREDNLKEIIKWIKAHPYFKWSPMCDTLGINRGNFGATIRTGVLKIKESQLPKIITELKKYGYTEEAGLPLPADYVDTNKTGVAILLPNGKKENIKVGEKIGKSKVTKVKNSNKGTVVTAKVELNDLTHPTGKKVITDSPPKSNYSIDTTKQKKESDYLASRRKLKQ